MVKMVLSASQTQASSVASVSQNKVQAYERVIQSLEAFTNEDQLNSTAYNNGKGHFEAVLVPLVQATVLLTEAVGKACQEFTDKYQSEVEGCDLDSDILKQQIQEAKTKISQLEGIRTSITSKDIPENLKENQLFQNGMVMERVFNNQKVLEDKLEKLLEFEATSPQIFADITELQTIVATGQAQAAGAWNGQAFVMPKDLSWTSTIAGKWQTRLDEIQAQFYDEATLEKEKNAAIKELNDLFTKNPIAAIERVKNNKRLFGYVIAGLDQCPKEIQDAALSLFIAQESWNQLPKTIANNVLNSPKFALYVEKLSLANQGKVYSSLITLSDKGWDVLAPISYVTTVLSKSSAGAKIIAGSRVGLNLFKKLGPIGKFIKEHPAVGEGLAYGGDALRITAYAYDEYCDPNSPAYGDASKALYGGINLFMLSAGPLEGAQYGGPVGALAGTVNYFGQGGGLSDMPGINKIPYVNEVIGWIDEKHTFITEEDKEKWIQSQYDIYDKRHEGLQSGDYSGFKIPNSEYKPGVPSHSGSPNSNPNFNNNIFPNGGN